MPDIRSTICAWFALLALPAGAAQLALTLDSIRHPAFEADGVTLAFDAQRRGEADIRLRKLRIAGTEYRELRLHCAGFYFDGKRLECPQGTVRRMDERGRDRPPLPFSLSYRAADGFLDFALRDVDAVALSPLVKRLRAWKPQGRVDFRIAMRDGRAELHLALRDAAFARDGFSGTGMALTLDAAATRVAAGWDWRATLDWPQGELTRAPWRREGGVRVTAAGQLAAAELDVRQARLEVAGFGAVNASLRWDRERDEAAAWGFVSEPLDLAAAMREWVQPWLAELGFPAWQTSGHALFSAEASGGRLRRFYAGLEDATLSDGTGYLELAGVTARIPWEAGAASEAEIGVASARLGELPLGSFALPLRIEGQEARVQNVVAPLLDGRFTIDELRLARGADGWQGEFSGGISDVSMPKLSRALRLPLMAGRLSAAIPRVSYEKGTLALNGALGIEVFDGGISVHDLRMIDAFSANRRLVVDVTARGLDLGMLTRTFAFGSIEGRFDADLHDLEMVGWKPLRFEARVFSSSGDYPRVVSYGALKDIAAMGAGPTVLAGVPERSGVGFGYGRIGVGCKLAGGVCLLEGLGHDGEGIVLMEGSGFPSVNIIGYNPRIDWEALVARIRDVIAGRPGLLIE